MPNNASTVVTREMLNAINESFSLLARAMECGHDVINLTLPDHQRLRESLRETAKIYASISFDMHSQLIAGLAKDENVSMHELSQRQMKRVHRAFTAMKKSIEGALYNPASHGQPHAQHHHETGACTAA